MMLTLCVNRPYPKLDDLLQFIRTQTGFIRVCVISMERSPRELVDSLGKTLNTTYPMLHMNVLLMLILVDNTLRKRWNQEEN